MLLDKNQNSINSLQQDLDSVSEKGSKFSWRTMCLSMPEIKSIIKFFTDYASVKNQAVRRTIEKVEFYDGEDGSLTEK